MDLQRFRVIPWFAGQGDEKIGLSFNLTRESSVFEVGGYKGVWTEAMIRKFDCNMYVFEPVKEFVIELRKKFADNPKVRIFDFGLADSNKKAEISISSDRSSVFSDGEDKVSIMLRDVVEVIDEIGLRKIDLMQINIEGGEYALLQRLIDSRYVEKVENIQVQFHDFVENAEQKMYDLYKSLWKSHFPTYHYKFVWDNWKLARNVSKDDLLVAMQSLVLNLGQAQDDALGVRVLMEQELGKGESKIKELHDTVAKLNAHILDLESHMEEKRGAGVNPGYYLLHPAQTTLRLKQKISRKIKK